MNTNLHNKNGELNRSRKVAFAWPAGWELLDTLKQDEASAVEIDPENLCVRGSCFQVRSVRYPDAPSRGVKAGSANTTEHSIRLSIEYWLYHPDIGNRLVDIMAMTLVDRLDKAAPLHEAVFDIEVMNERLPSTQRHAVQALMAAERIISYILKDKVPDMYKALQGFHLPDSVLDMLSASVVQGDDEDYKRQKLAANYTTPAIVQAWEDMRDQMLKKKQANLR